MLARSDFASDFKCQFSVTFDVAFGEIDIVGGKQALGILNELVRMVEGILMTIEAESRLHCLTSHLPTMTPLPDSSKGLRFEINCY